MIEIMLGSWRDAFHQLTRFRGQVFVVSIFLLHIVNDVLIGALGDYELLVPPLEYQADKVSSLLTVLYADVMPRACQCPRDLGWAENGG